MPKIVDKSEEQKDAEADVEGFHDNLGPFVVAAETTRMAMVFSDACDRDNPIIFANDSFLELTGYSREEVPPRPRTVSPPTASSSSSLKMKSWTSVMSSTF